MFASVFRLVWAVSPSGSLFGYFSKRHLQTPHLVLQITNRRFTMVHGFCCQPSFSMCGGLAWMAFRTPKRSVVQCFWCARQFARLITGKKKHLLTNIDKHLVILSLFGLARWAITNSSLWIWDHWCTAWTLNQCQCCWRSNQFKSNCFPPLPSQNLSSCCCACSQNQYLSPLRQGGKVFCHLPNLALFTTSLVAFENATAEGQRVSDRERLRSSRPTAKPFTFEIFWSHNAEVYLTAQRLGPSYQLPWCSLIAWDISTVKLYMERRWITWITKYF